jgi:hypothetical protein
MGSMERVNVFAKQVLSQLSYTPTVEVTFILKHFQRFQNPLLRFSSQLCQNKISPLFVRQGSFGA